VFISACNPLFTAVGTGSLAYNVVTQNIQGVVTGTLGKIMSNPFEEDQEHQQPDSVKWNFK